jgi:cation diffusion facilitator CzcD-associated flavoprotein CzcO
MTKPTLDVAIIGAGPYGLSLAAHLAARGVDHRIFGEPMGAWKNNMPAGMLLKSYPWASCLSDPKDEFSIKRFSLERALPYHDEMMPLPIESFVEYGEAFAARYVPAVERRLLVSLKQSADGFDLAFDDGETVRTRRVAVAVGLHPFKRLPEEAARLPSDLCSHSGEYGSLASLDGKEVIVIGTGSSATDLAALLSERGIHVSLAGRSPKLQFADRPRTRSWFERVSAPMSGIGHGWTLGTCAKCPQLIHLLPEETRIRLAQTRALGPLGGAFMKDRVVGKVPMWLGHTVSAAEARAGSVLVKLADQGGKRQTLRADHVIFATGYRTDVARLGFLNPDLVRGMRLTATAPQLSRDYESSVPGLHFIGPASANSFGPVSRFVYGAYHPARHLASHLAAVLPRRAASFVRVRHIEIDAAAPALVPDRKQREVLS